MRTRIITALAVTATLLTASAAGAQEASKTRISEGTPEYTLGLNCASIIFGGGGNALPTFVPPSGTEVVEDPELKPYWSVYRDEKFTIGDDPVVVNTGPDGRAQVGVRDLSDGKVKPWTYADSGGFITVFVAMRARRKLNGIGSRRPSCREANDGRPACAPEQSGDYLQVSTEVADEASPSTLVPNLGLFAREPAAPKVSVSRRVAARGFTVRTTTAPGFRVRATLRRAGRRVGGAGATASRTGTTSLRLRSSRPGRTSLQVVALADDGAASKPTVRTVTVR